MSTRLVTLWISAAVCLGAVNGLRRPPTVDFVRDVKPILREHCYECHGDKQQKNGLRLDRRRDAMRGGTATVIGRGNGEASKLYQRLIGSRFGRQMPPDGPLPASQVAIIKAWIDQGAHWPDAAAGDVVFPPPDPAASRMMAALRSAPVISPATLALKPAVLNRPGPNGATPLMYAVLYRDLDAVRAMLDAGADPNIADHAGATALLWAANDYDKTKLLIERGADVNARSADGRTPLMIAAARAGGAATARLLLEHGADPLTKPSSGAGEASPFLQSFRSGDASLMRLFVDKGGDLRRTTPAAFLSGLRTGCDECATAVLNQWEPDALNAALIGAVPPRGNSQWVTRLLDAGADPNTKDGEGRSVLMLAAASDDFPEAAVQAFIARGADVNAVSPAGETALGMASLRGETPITRLLKRAGARAAPPLEPAPAAFAAAQSARAAVMRALPLLQKADVAFLSKSGCVSCHHNSLTAMTVALARAKRLPVDERVAREQTSEIAAYLDRWRDRVLQGIPIGGASYTTSFILVGLGAERHEGDAATDAMARYLLGQQASTGQWRHVSHRPPLESSEIQVAAMAMRALQLYAPAARRAEYQRAIERAAAWLQDPAPVTTEDRVFQLLGLHWSGAPAASITPRATALLARQRADGGWSQLDTLDSDAYATGQALYALVVSGALPTTDPAYERGVRFLLRTQFPDGSWYVRSRALPIQPYFETGFPFGRDQFISAAATNWSCMALALGL